MCMHKCGVHTPQYRGVYTHRANIIELSVIGRSMYMQLIPKKANSATHGNMILTRKGRDTTILFNNCAHVS